MRYYLAIDIGASSGRHIVAHLENGKMITEEIYRFQNGPEMLTAYDGMIIFYQIIDIFFIKFMCC